MPGNKSKFIIFSMICALLMAVAICGVNKAEAFEPFKSDLTKYDPHNQTFPPISDDVIKVGIFWPFTGPAAINGNIYWLTIGMAVYDINNQGGLMVGGKKRKIVLIKGDHQMKPTVAKRAMEKLCLEDKVDLIIGTTGTHLNLVGQQVAAKYGKIYLNVASLADSLMQGKSWNKFTFRTCATNSMLAKALAQFYGMRSEKKFYILCQDYTYGHQFAKNFKEALKITRPDAEIVGEDYHPLFVKDFAPYLTKIKGTDAQVIISADYTPDLDNLVKQADQLGVNLPIAGPFTANPIPLQTIKPPHGNGLVAVQSYVTNFTKPKNVEMMNKWHDSWKTWKAPLYNGPLFKWPLGILPQSMIGSYWLFKVIEKADSLDAEKIIAAWEGDEIELFGNKYKMRACDHQAIFDMNPAELNWPNNFFKKAATSVNAVTIPAAECTQPLPKDLPQCNK